MEPAAVAIPLLRPVMLYSRQEVLARPCPVPAEPGVYGWYFDRAPGVTPLAGTHVVDGWFLLYVGISPKAPSREGPRTSRQSLRSRIRYHYRGNAAGSTLRLTLGCLLADELGIGLRRVGSGNRLTFNAGELVLSEWMATHARVCWMRDIAPWTVESRLIEQLYVPLNLDQNTSSTFRSTLSAARAAQRVTARTLPVISK
jgi:hypothetical protein